MSGDTGWMRDAGCRGMGPDLFFIESPAGRPGATARNHPAKQVCASCPVRAECLEWAMTNREPKGVWGGLTPRERLRLRRKRRSVA